MSKQKKVIVLIGPQGSGKSTLLKHFMSKGFIGITMSDVLKEKSKNDPAFAKKYHIGANIGRGTLVPDEGIRRAFVSKLKGYKLKEEDFILDGCTRTIQQLFMVYNEFIFSHRIIFLNIECPIDVCLERIKNRVKIDIANGNEPRIDDVNNDGEFDKEKVRARIMKFVENLPPIVEGISSSLLKYFVIDGEMPPDIVVAEAESYLSKID